MSVRYVLRRLTTTVNNPTFDGRRARGYRSKQHFEAGWVFGVMVFEHNVMGHKRTETYIVRPNETIRDEFLSSILIANSIEGEPTNAAEMLLTFGHSAYQLSHSFLLRLFDILLKSDTIKMHDLEDAIRTENDMESE